MNRVVLANRDAVLLASASIREGKCDNAIHHNQSSRAAFGSRQLEPAAPIPPWVIVGRLLILKPLLPRRNAPRIQGC